MTSRRIAFISALLLPVLLIAAAGRAAVYHVGPKGSDDAEGSAQAPWQTPAKAIYSATPGDDKRGAMVWRSQRLSDNYRSGATHLLADACRGHAARPADLLNSNSDVPNESSLSG